MSLLSRLERKFGRFAVPNLTVLLIIGQVLLFVAVQLKSEEEGFSILDRMQMYPGKVLAGDWWRVITFLFNPPGTNVIIFAFLFWYVFYLMGTTLEASWGVFRYNLFLAIGYVASIASAFGVYFATGQDAPASNVFLQGTVFLAFARLFPDFVMYLFFILPVKIKWLALFQWMLYTLTFLFGTWMVRAMVAASVANYFLFFGRDIWQSMKQGHRQMQHQARSLKSPPKIVHKCAVCGITSETSPQTQFRYCSKCDGERCYCPEHLKDHEHVSKKVSAT